MSGRLIGVAGQAQNGKDSLADHLQEVLNGSCGDGYCGYWDRGAFAKAVKEIFMRTFDKDAAYVEKWKVAKEAPPDLDMPVRKALQFIGDGFRTIKSSVWIDVVLRDETPRIISDCRYVNELKVIHENGGFNILVVRPDKINDDPNGSEAQMRPFAEFVVQLKKHFPQYAVSYPAESVYEILRYFAWSLPDGWQYLNHVIINKGSLEDLYQAGNGLVQAVNQHFKR